MKETYCGICKDVQCTAGMQIDDNTVLGRWINKRGTNTLVKTAVTIEDCEIRRAVKELGVVRFILRNEKGNKNPR